VNATARDVQPLRLAAPILPPLLSRDSGPGLRWLIFLQGCARPCTDRCLNPGFLDPLGGFDASPTQLRLAAGEIAAGAYGPVEGVTVLGGEPTDQAEALYPLLAWLRDLGMSVMLYSGRTLKQLECRPATRALMAHCDLLVDGPFIPALASQNLVWRGSSNQAIRRLSGRHSRAELDRAKGERGLTVHLPTGAPVSISGLQSRRAAAEVERALALAGRSQRAAGPETRGGPSSSRERDERTLDLPAREATG